MLLMTILYNHDPVIFQRAYSFAQRRRRVSWQAVDDKLL